MITRILLNQTATYTEPVEIKPNKINYFFGSNGSGKTSLSKVISDCISYKDCHLEWQTKPLETIVYNRDFVKNNFGQSSVIKGIFTLGKDSIEVQEFIETSKKVIAELNNNLFGLRNTNAKKSSELKDKEIEVANKAWSIMRKYENFFKTAYKGSLTSAKVFFEKCLSEIGNNSDLLSEDDIKVKCNRVYSSSLKPYLELDSIDISKIYEFENEKILSAKIVGKEDIEISVLIRQLQNSDWIKEGVEYLNKTVNTCPFCQQKISLDLKNEIESFFDESFNNKVQELKKFKASYIEYIGRILNIVKGIMAGGIEILNFEHLNEKFQLLEEIYKNNLYKIDDKINHPSNCIELESLEEILKNIASIIETFNETIKINNKTVQNLSTEKELLKSEIWRFIVNELDFELKAYLKFKEDISKAQNSLSKSISEKEVSLRNLEKQIKEKEAEVTSIIHTVNEINKLLSLFGFTNFKLAKASEKGFYKIIREDGTAVKETLSEGEYTFITFLYFYYLLKGSNNDTGLKSDKVVVIDDPISSLDSNVLFVVSNLIKTIVADARNTLNGIHQIFILTHNIYFYKEVTFKGNKSGKWNEETYWNVRKLNNKTSILEHKENPIQTTYELLWQELYDIEKVNKATIFNTLRRILEYYFNIIGGLSYEKAINQFEGEEQLICKSLISWINDGSHFINDDLVMYVEPETIEKYLKVFELIFTEMGHKSHYNMMMKREIIAA